MKLTFVSGTGTDVGKTYIAANLAQILQREHRRVGVYKPVASGCIGPSSNFSERTSSDADALAQSLGEHVAPELICPQRFLAPLAPDEAARQEGTQVDTDLLYEGAVRWQRLCDHLVVEGAGGLFSPIADSMLNIDLYRKFSENREFETKLVLVAPNRLGVIHETVATCRAARAEGVEVERLVLTATVPQGDDSCKTNAAQLRVWLPELRIIEVGWQQAVVWN
ncbi:dethiobiotin synthase [Stieleria sp. JC731]|uniref:dethiobiotin synthase n=1 Tax=Pirellulaceae TaxID=2691357 RepID=UPI001E34566A|nr:dethiobiotin synthase [Stieleria sp. JC731]MCC9601087.1 dethiobiotin synthase [Stieleria sp. JC731]